MIKKLFYFAVLVLGVMMAVPAGRVKMADTVRPFLDRAKVKMVPSRLQAMADQLAVRVGRGEGYPNNWPGWLERDYSGVPEDPWGNVYYLKQNRNGFVVGSNGPDGLPGSADDLTLERRMRR
jgi:hypothetical protein